MGNSICLRVVEVAVHLTTTNLQSAGLRTRRRATIRRGLFAGMGMHVTEVAYKAMASQLVHGSHAIPVIRKACHVVGV